MAFVPSDLYLTKVKKIPVDGPRPLNSYFIEDKLLEEKLKAIEDFKAGAQHCCDDRLKALVNDLNWLESYIRSSVASRPRLSGNPVDLLTSRALGLQRLQSPTYNVEVATRHLIHYGLWRERVYNLSPVNKIFCCEWLTDSQIILGTKCNTLIVLDILTGRTFKIATLKSSGRHEPPQNSCGIHATEANPSKSLLATGGESPNELAIYRLPTLDPVCVGEGSHKDWIFDLKWLDDEFLVTGSRDSTLSLWRINDEVLSEGKLMKPDANVVQTEKEPSQDINPGYVYIKPLINILCKDGIKIRALTFNHDDSAIAALTLNSRVHIFDARTMKQKCDSIKLPTLQDNVCLAHYKNGGAYAIGSKSSIVVINKDLSCDKIPLDHRHSGVRSISFSGDLLTIGTGSGAILFIDMRQRRYLLDTREPVTEPRGSSEKTACLNSSQGYVSHDEAYYDAFLSNMDYSPAIYTHRYDSTGTRLFAAGGPLPASLFGNYAALWL